MQGFSLGAGLAALAFWGFLAAVIVSGIWYDIRKREAQQETVRRLFESGQQIDEALMDKLLALGGSKSDRLDRSLKLAGLVMLPIAVGMAIFGLILGSQYPEALSPLLGVAALIACMGIGFLVAARIAERWYLAGSDTAARQL